MSNLIISPSVTLTEVYNSNKIEIRAYEIQGELGVWSFIDELEEDCKVCKDTIRKVYENNKDEFPKENCRIFRKESLSVLNDIRNLNPRGHRMLNRDAVKRVLMLLEKSEVAKKARNVMIAESKFVEESKNLTGHINNFANAISKMSQEENKTRKLLYENVILLTKYVGENNKKLVDNSKAISNHEQRLQNLESVIYKKKTTEENEDVKDRELIPIMELIKELNVDGSTLRKYIKRRGFKKEKRRVEVAGRRIYVISRLDADIIRQEIKERIYLNTENEITIIDLAKQMGVDVSYVRKLIKSKNIETLLRKHENQCLKSLSTEDANVIKKELKCS